MVRRYAPALLVASLLAAAAAHAADRPADDPLVDCRYRTTEDRPAAEGEGRLSPAPFPGDDVFRPLLADPKQPQFFASYQHLRAREPGTDVNAAFVGFGEYFGLWGLRREGCDGIQVGVAGGVFAQFNLDAPSSDLINADYVIGLPVSVRRGLWSGRLRLYHQSSHVGDEFLLGNPDFERVNLSFEEVELIGSVERRWARLYAGGGVLVNKEPSDLDIWRVQWGAELRGPGFLSPFSGPTLGEVRVTPVLGADFKSFEELGWTVNMSVAGGLEWSSERSARRARLLLTYLRGHNPYGQFFDQRIESVGVGFFLAF